MTCTTCQKEISTFERWMVDSKPYCIDCRQLVYAKPTLDVAYATPDNYNNLIEAQHDYFMPDAVEDAPQEPQQVHGSFVKYQLFYGFCTVFCYNKEIAEQVARDIHHAHSKAELIKTLTETDGVYDVKYN